MLLPFARLVPRSPFSYLHVFRPSEHLVIRDSLFRRLLIPFLVALCSCCPLHAQQENETRGAPAETTDAPEIRDQIQYVEGLLPKFPDRGAALYFLAVARQHLGQTLPALQNLKECLELQEGFDPSGSAEFASLRGTHDFDALVEKVHTRFPAVSQSRVAVLAEARDLVPEGLAWDERRQVFYLSSLNLRRIVQITPESRSSDFAPSNGSHFFPILGIRVDPKDDTVWAASFEESGKAELLHFDESGALLGRFSPHDSARHGFNDLIVRANREVILTDSLANSVFRFDPLKQVFSPLVLHRRLIYPNGIALAPDDYTLFVADALGVICIDLDSLSSRDVDPGRHSTLAGIDGLYWHDGSLVAVQNGIGSPRVAAFRLSKDGLRVTRTTVLESRTPLTELPTTGAIRGSDFYFITNSQIDNLLNGKVRDVTLLAPIRIAVVSLP
jgi:hypothetical protein